MKLRTTFLLLALTPGLVCALNPSKPVGGTPQDSVFYVGKTGKTHFESAFQLSNGALLVGGGTASFDWLPPNIKPVALQGPVPMGGDTGLTPFIMHLAPDGKRILGVYTLRAGCAEGIASIKTTSIPGSPTGDLFIAGRVKKDPMTSRKVGGFFIAKLDGNFVTKPATKITWGHFVKAEGALLTDRLPWDVAPDGSVIYATGNPYGYDWLAVEKIGPDGKPAMVPNWRRHWIRDDSGNDVEFEGLLKDAPAGKPLYSAIVLKINGRGDFRSWTKEDWLAKVPDGNGGFNQGQWPFDGMFSGPYDPETKNTLHITNNKRGWYGYKWGRNPTAGIGAIVIDRRDGTLFIGGNNQSNLPNGGLPDFEPWVIAMDPSGKKLWWSRLYPESKGVSTPDQYVDDLAIDYSVSPQKGGALVVLARCHGNNVNNFWNGPDVKAPGAGKGFQPQFTGRHGNIHYGWIGRLSTRNGTLLGCTYMGEFNEGQNHGDKAFSNPILSHWPSTTSGWPSLNTTKAHGIAIDAKGRTYVIATGRRVITTSNAFQQMPSPLADPEKKGVWSDFVRVYHQNLSDLDYSSLMTGLWNWDDGKDGSDIKLADVLPVQGGVLVLGYAPLSKDGSIKGNDMPTRNVPAWGQKSRTCEAGVFGILRF